MIVRGNRQEMPYHQGRHESTILRISLMDKEDVLAPYIEVTFTPHPVEKFLFIGWATFLPQINTGEIKAPVEIERYSQLPFQFTAVWADLTMALLLLLTTFGYRSEDPYQIAFTNQIMVQRLLKDVAAIAGL